MGRSEKSCFRGERRSVDDEAGMLISRTDKVEGICCRGGPKMVAWSSTREEIRGAGTLRVGAKTMPTERC